MLRPDDRHHLRIVGYNPDVDTGTTPEDVSPVSGAVTFPSAGQASVKAGGNAADASAGTGAQVIFIEGVDGSYNPIKVTEALAGASAKNLGTTDFLWINHARVLNVGSGGVNAGDITFQIGATDVGRILAGQGKMLQAIYVVPGLTGLISYVSDFWVSAGGVAASQVVCELQVDTLAYGWETLVRGFAHTDAPNPARYMRAADGEEHQVAVATRIRARVMTVGVDSTQVSAGFKITHRDASSYVRLPSDTEDVSIDVTV